MYSSMSEAGLASLAKSPYRDSDVMNVQMTPREVAGLQQLALSQGATPQDLYDPVTGQPRFSFLKKLLPTIIGATLKTVAPGFGQAVGKMLPFGLSDEAASNVGTALVVGGATGLIEGDLKKGLQAGLGAYSGATLASGLEQAGLAARQAAEASRVSNAPVSPSTLAQQLGLKEKDLLHDISPDKGYLYKGINVGDSKGLMGVDVNMATPPLPPVAYTPPTQAADVVKTVTKRPGFFEGVNALFTPEGRKAFGQATGGGFQSPIGQTLSQYATSYGALMPFAQEQKPFPGAGGGVGEDIVYIPGGFNPQYGTGKDQPYQLPGQYYKRTPKGLVPYNPFQLAPGFAGGGIIPRPNGNYPLAKPSQALGGYGMSIDPYTGEEKFADGGPINVPAYAPPTQDRNVLATRAYIEELNRRARAGGDGASQATSGGGLGSFGGAGIPTQTGGGGGVGGGGGGGGEPGVGDIVGGIATNYLVNKGVGAGVDYLRQKFFPNVDDLKEVEVTGRRVPTEAGAGGGGSSTAGVPTTAGLGSLGTLGGLNSTGLGALQPTTVADAANMTSLSSAYAPSGSVASRFGGMRGALNAGAGAGVVNPSSLVNSSYAQLDPSLYQAPSTVTSKLSGEGLGSLQGKIIPGLQTALGAYQTAKAIEAGKEGRAAFSAAATMPAAAKLLNIGAIGGPVGMLAAAAIAAIGASLVKTEEMGASSLKNYWNGVDQGRGIGQTDADELARGFINFYRTNKNEFPGQAKYGRKGNEDFVYDMTQVINNAVKDGKVDKNVDPATMYKQVVQPWLNTMGEGPKNKDARRIQDFMMTDLINSFMQGKPISNAQVKGDKKFKIVSEKPVYAGAAPVQEVKQPEFQNIPAAATAIRQAMKARSPYAAPEERATIMPTRESVPITPDFSNVDPGLVPQTPPEGTQPRLSGYVPPPDFGDEPQLPSPFARGQQPRPKQYISTGDLKYNPETGRYEPSQTLEVQDEGQPSGIVPFNPNDPRFFNMGGAVGDGYNFGFARGGMSSLPEYKAGGKLLNGPGDGMSDNIPAVIRGKSVQRAALADGEFVIPADVVSHLGNGSTNAGAKKLYKMMAQVRRARTGRSKQAPAVKMDKYLPA